MNARDDMEVDLDTMRDVYMTKAQREAYERICAQALVERAGEPVAVIRSAKEPYGTRFLPEEWDRLENLPNGTRLIAIPPTAPGASHER